MCIGDHAGGGACGVILPGGLAAQGALRSLARARRGSQMAHARAYPPAELPDERLMELVEQAQRWVEWATAESTRRAALQAEAATPAAQPP